jgi:broad specificity phosphatase PhoE
MSTNETTRVLLIRHGESQGNAERRFGGHTPTPLSQLGHAQAEATARALASEGITAIFRATFSAQSRRPSRSRARRACA